MSLIPYQANEGREIVLRHHNAIVVRDPSSQRLEIRSLPITECPTCHQPLRAPSPERHFTSHDQHESYVDPGYFRMLRDGRHGLSTPQPGPPSSPIRRLVQPVSPAVSAHTDDSPAANAGFAPSSPPTQEPSRIQPKSLSPNYFNDFFVEERVLGKGGKGVVFLVRHELDGCPLGHFACKRVPVGDDHAWLERVLIEVELLARLSHPNLVSYRHAWLEDVQITRFGPPVVCAFILQQYCNAGDLLQHVLGDLPKESTKEQLKAQLRRRSKGHAERPQGLQRRLPPEEIYSLFKNITSGLAYLHANNYIHRDLKPSNCLLHREGNQLVCLISDFGEVQAKNTVRNSTGSTGTISYCAPEVLVRDASGRYGNFTTQSDMFSLGMILYFMCFGRLPYHSANIVHEELEDIDELRAEITDWKGFEDERRERPDLPPKLYQLLKKLLSVKPAERPSANEVIGAMKGEAPLDAVPRVVRNSSPALGMSARIQNLDSPLPPSTPVPDPTKHARVTPSVDEDLPGYLDGDSSSLPVIPQNGLLQKRNPRPPSPPPGPRHRHHHNGSLTLTRSQDGFDRSLSRSPERMGTMSMRASRNGSSVSPMASPATITTPLLMPPANTTLERVRNEAALKRYQLAAWLHRNSASSRSALQLLFLSVKLVSLTWFCWPYSSSLSVLVSVFILAMLDLWNPPTGGDGSLSRRGGGLMIRVGMNSEETLTDHGNVEPVGTVRWFTGWRRSVVLLVLHFVILWVTSRLGALCVAARHESWLGP